jgi:hypothetical protein
MNDSEKQANLLNCKIKMGLVSLMLVMSGSIAPTNGFSVNVHVVLYLVYTYLCSEPCADVIRQVVFRPNRAAPLFLFHFKPFLL